MSEARVRILVVDDDEDDYAIFKDHLLRIEDRRFDLEWAPSFDAGVERLQERRHDVGFFDYRLGGQTGLDLLKRAIELGSRMPIILLTGYGEHDIDLEAMKSGAADYLVKDQVTPSLLERSIRYALHRAQNLEALRAKEAEVLVQDRLASVGLLASSLAHEIGTPLGVIRGRAEYLALQLQENEAVKKNADIIISQIDRVSTLIRSLLNLARGDQVGPGQETHLNRVVSEVLELLNHELKKHSIEVRNEILDGPQVIVMAQPGPMHQVLLNLFVNAMHALDSAALAGRTAPRVLRVGAQDLGDRWVLNVEDTGCGISPENMRNLFKPFFTTKELGSGTGLGLATSYRIVEAWGGRIDVQSEVGVGSTFRISLSKPTSRSL